MKKYKLLLTLITVLSISNCASIIGTFFVPPSKENISFLYRGVELDIHGLTSVPHPHGPAIPGFVFVLDLPFSFALDTALLPVTIPYTTFNFFYFREYNQKLFDLITEGKKEEFAQVIKSSNANSRLRFSGNTTLLIHAVQLNKIDFVKILLDNNADVNLFDSMDNTALIHSIYYPADDPKVKPSIDMYELLMSKGADYKFKDYATIVAAIERNRPDIALDLMKRVPNIGKILDEKQEGILSKVIESFNSHKLDLIKYLVATGANVNHPGESGKNSSPMYLAAVADDPSILEYLISQKANINGSNNHPEPPLYAALLGKKSKSVPVLRKYGAKEINLNTGNTALITQVETLNLYDLNEEIKNVEFYLKFKVDKKAKNKEGKTAFDALQERTKYAKENFAGSEQLDSVLKNLDKIGNLIK